MMPGPSVMASLTRGGAAAGGSLDTQTVTNATTTTGSDPYYNWAGYRSASPALGSRADGTSNIYGGASVVGLYFFEEYHVSPLDGFIDRKYVLEINGTQLNSGWATLTIGGQVFYRADANFSTDGSKSSWVWQESIPNQYVGATPGLFSGASTVCTFA